MTASAELRQIADTLILVDPDAYERLHRIARDLDKRERTLDAIVADARLIERMSRPLAAEGEIIEPFLERALRLSSREKL